MTPFLYIVSPIIIKTVTKLYVFRCNYASVHHHNGLDIKHLGCDVPVKCHYHIVI